MAGEYPKKVWDYTQPGELVGLKWEDVDFKSKTIQIRRSMEYRYSAKEWRIGELKSKSGCHTILLTEEAIAILKNKKKRIRGFQKYSKIFDSYLETYFCYQMYRSRNETENTSDVTGAFKDWNYNERICSYYRGRKEKRNGIGSRSTYYNVMAH